MPENPAPMRFMQTLCHGDTASALMGRLPSENRMFSQARQTPFSQLQKGADRRAHLDACIASRANCASWLQASSTHRCPRL